MQSVAAKLDVVPRTSPGLRGIDADTLIRSILFLAVFLTVWITFHPFPNLAKPPPPLADSGNRANEIGYSALFVLFAAWIWRHEPRRLTFLVRPALLAALAWWAISIVTSWMPELALRRLVFTLVVMSLAAVAPLIPKNLRHFSDLLTAGVLIVLVACYAGLALVPHLSIHQATDFLEPEHAGDWRGVFPHKNDAGAAMVLFVFVGLFVARMRSRALGGLIVVAAAVFLAFTRSKTAIGMLPLVLILSFVVARSRRCGFGVGLVGAILGLLLLISVGSVYFGWIHSLLAAIMPDANFTGRTAIWKLGLQALARRPLTGYGFSAFFGTPRVVFGLAGNSTWANVATDAHNAYLNLALGIGVPGLALTMLSLIFLPIVDFYRGPHDSYTRSLQILFLRVCLYGLLSSCFESELFVQAGPVWFFYLVSVFGLRYLAATRIIA